MLFELISERYERKSLAITANTPFSQWGEVFVEPAMTLAAVDRLVHHATILEMNVESYWLDKSAAQSGQWRISEASLLMFGLFGGWPGAIVAQQTLRHKTAKASFRLAFWATVILNIGAFLYITSPAFSGVAKG